VTVLYPEGSFGRFAKRVAASTSRSSASSGVIEEISSARQSIVFRHDDLSVRRGKSGTPVF